MKWNDNFNKKYTLISIYVIITAVVIYVLSLIAKGAPVIIAVALGKLEWLMGVSKPILIGFVFAYLLDPIVDFFEAYYKKVKIRKWEIKSTRSLAVLTTILLFFIIVVGIISVLVFNVTDQLRVANFNDLFILAQTYINNLNDFYDNLMKQLNKLNIESAEVTQYVKNAVTYLLNALRNIGQGTVSSVGNLSSFFTTFLFSLIISIYFMIDGKGILSYLRKVGNAILNEKWNRRISGFLKDADGVFSGYIRGQMLDALVMMILISLLLSIIGVKYGLLIGILAGIGNLIPYCGPFIAYALTILACLVTGEFKQLIVALIALFVIQAIDGNVIAPKLLSQSIQIHPVLVIIFLIFGNAIGGLFGMILAVPVGGLIKLLFVRFIDNRLDKKSDTAV